MGDTTRIDVHLDLKDGLVSTTKNNQHTAMKQDLPNFSAFILILFVKCT
jgi:hypothetical protein